MQPCARARRRCMSSRSPLESGRKSSPRICLISPTRSRHTESASSSIHLAAFRAASSSPRAPASPSPVGARRVAPRGCPPRVSRWSVMSDQWSATCPSVCETICNAAVPEPGHPSGFTLTSMQPDLRTRSSLRARRRAVGQGGRKAPPYTSVASVAKQMRKRLDAGSCNVMKSRSRRSAGEKCSFR